MKTLVLLVIVATPSPKCVESVRAQNEALAAQASALPEPLRSQVLASATKPEPKRIELFRVADPAAPKDAFPQFSDEAGCYEVAVSEVKLKFKVVAVADGKAKVAPFGLPKP